MSVCCTCTRWTRNPSPYGEGGVPSSYGKCSIKLPPWLIVWAETMAPPDIEPVTHLSDTCMFWTCEKAE